MVRFVPFVRSFQLDKVVKGEKPFSVIPVFKFLVIYLLGQAQFNKTSSEIKSIHGTQTPTNYFSKHENLKRRLQSCFSA